MYVPHLKQFLKSVKYVKCVQHIVSNPSPTAHEFSHYNFHTVSILSSSNCLVNVSSTNGCGFQLFTSTNQTKPTGSSYG